MNWIQIAVASLLTALLSFGAGYIVVAHLQAKQREALTAQISADTTHCDAAKTVTKEANDAIQKDHKRITDKRITIRVQHTAACLPITGTTQLPASGGKPTGQNGIDTGTLRDYAAEAEGYRSDLLTCEKFIAKERALKK